MALRATFVKAADTAFSLFKEAVRTGTYKHSVNTGFKNTINNFPVSVIEGSFAEDDIKYLSFSEYIQPQDVKALIRGKEIKSAITTQSDKIAIIQEDGTAFTYTVVAFDTDPFKVLYTFLLRKT